MSTFLEMLYLCSKQLYNEQKSNTYDFGRLGQIN